MYTTFKINAEVQMDRIRQLRKERGLSQAKLAVMADMDPATLNRLERGTGNPNLKTLERVANVLEVGVADLLGKAKAPLPFEEAAGGRRTLTLDADLWREHCESLAGFFEDLAGRDAPPSRALGWWDVVPNVAGYVLAVVDTLLEGVQDGTISDDEDELIPLLRAGYRLAHVADELWSQGVEALAGEIEQASIELQFWKMTEGLELTSGQREQITA